MAEHGQGGRRLEQGYYGWATVVEQYTGNRNVTGMDPQEYIIAGIDGFNKNVCE